MKEFIRLTPLRFRHRTLFLLPDEITSIEKDPANESGALVICSSGERYKVLNTVEEIERQFSVIDELNKRNP